VIIFDKTIKAGKYDDKERKSKFNTKLGRKKSQIEKNFSQTYRCRFELYGGNEV
jgi:hypothetical protein